MTDWEDWPGGPTPHCHRAAKLALIPGVGEQAWAKAGGMDSIDQVAFLRGDTWVTISASLQPGITRNDLPALATLARAIDRRLSGFRLPEPQNTEKQQKMIEKLEEKTRRHTGK